ncbi:recombinase family protein, partial [Streptomyces sp. NPDC052013]|uniref:recombinase family protein n=1 Tax=Streptomyces sp. NPDC052013 TaxID=3365679 RepID=UPI0037D42A0C
MTASHLGCPLLCAVSGGLSYAPAVTGTLIGYARCSTDEQGLTAQRVCLLGLGVPEDRICLDRGLTGTNRDRPGLAQALATVRAGDTLVVPKTGPARSLDARRPSHRRLPRRPRSQTVAERGALRPGGPDGKDVFSILVTFAECEVDLLRMLPARAWQVARANGHLKGEQPKLSARQQAHLVRQHKTEEHTRSPSSPSRSRSAGVGDGRNVDQWRRLKVDPLQGSGSLSQTGRSG